MAIPNIVPRCVIAITLFLTVVSAAQAKYSGGTGEPNDPYQIATAEELMLLGETPEDYDKHFILTTDIDLDPNLPGRKVFDKAVIAPDIDSIKEYFQGTRFTGIFDGNWHTISNLTVKGKDYLGLFGHVIHPAQVRRLGIVNINISGSGDYIGGLAGRCDCSINTSYSNGTVSGSNYVGGLTGESDGSIKHCCSAGEIAGTGYGIGGLMGEGNATGCYFIGTVVGDRYVGGLVGFNRGGTFTSFSAGPVNGNESVGGLVGDTNWNRTVNGCFWDIETSGQVTTRYGTGKTTAEMQTAATFLEAGWDFVGETANGTEDIWWIDEGKDYPRLWWQKYSGGTGEPNDPYQIATAADLILLGETSEDYDKHFIMTTDIDLDPNLPGRKVFDRAVIAPDVDPNDEWGGTPFTGFSFVGTFDGDGHRISHLTIKGMGYLGLFGKLTSNAEIKNIGVLDVSITGSMDFVGGLVGLNHGGTVMQCYGSGIVSGDWCVGGLVGRNYTGNITKSYTTGIVSGNHWIGGLAGDSGGSVSNCYSMAVVSGIDGVGGLVGYVWHTISRCYSVGFVSGEHNVGGLFGEANVAYAYIVSCFWDIQTSGQATSYGGTGLTTEKMQNADTFFAWGVCGGGGVWTINEGADYPRLHWENQPGKDISNAPLSRLLMGTGGEDDPFLIHTPEQLYLIGLFPCEWDKHFKLMADINLSEYDGKNGHLAFNIIGRSYDSPFTGIFDGNGHKISDLTITGIYYVGLFGHLFPGAEVRNLGVVDVNITGIEDYVGGLVGQNGGSVKQCYSTGTVCGSTYVGGLVGYNTVGIVEQSYSTCTVMANYDVAGGLAGGNTGEVIHCYSTGPTSGVYSVGGLIGRNCMEVFLPSIDGSITNCFWDIQTSGQVWSDGGTGKTTTEMQTASTFLEAGWDFVDETANGTEDIWWILEGQDYPRLWWETE